MMPRYAVLLPLLLALSACSSPKRSPAAEADRIANEFADGYYHQFPEEAYEIGYPDTPMDRLGDRSQAAMDAWRTKEDAWIAQLHALDTTALKGAEAWVPYAFTLDRLEASKARRICRTELWNVSPTWTGWQSMLGSTFAIQPVGTDKERADALARLSAVPAYIDREIANLKLGVTQKYLAPKSNVARVLAQVDAILASTPEETPFGSPIVRAQDEAFKGAARAVVTDSIRPAVQRYRNYLGSEYVGRDSVGVAANPDGEACYRASVRFHTSLALDPREIHETGLKEMARIQDEMRQIATKSFGTSDVKALLEKLRTDPKYTFRTEADVIAYAKAAVDRAAVAVHDWFGTVPTATLVIRPFPAYQKSSGGGFYSSGSADGKRPGTYELGTYDPTHISKAGMEATAFHETWPGHHLQMSIALYGGHAHPVLRYVYVAATAEGWGLYSEKLADEMKLYTSDVDRLGMLSNQALRAARLVVDPGMHVLGWTRDRAIQYMLDNTAEGRNSVESEIDRYIAVPAQATAYMTGSLEIQRLRHEAERELGDRFDIKGFHDTVLRNGAVTLPMLREAVAAWVVERKGGRG